MVTRQDRTKPTAFIPDERSLGGAHRIMSDYASHYRRLGEVKPTRSILEANKTTWHTTAQQLSTNRAAKQSAVNSLQVEHVNNIYHLNQRIENSYSSTERAKNPYDPTMFPVHQKRGSNLYKSGAHNAMLSWIPGTGRPKSAPAPRRRASASHGDGYQGWSLTKDLRDAFCADDFPLHVTYKQMQHDSAYVAYKRAIMQEIIEQRMYREADLRQLLRSYQKLAPLRDKEAVDRVVQDLKLELDVGP